jgi:hypothetical protein
VGVYGHLVIGVNTGAALATSANTFASNGNYVIDGSNTVGGTTRDLTLEMIGASVSNRIVRVFGDNDGVVIKNLKINFQDTAGSYATLAYSAGNVSGLGDICPDNGVVQNCYLRASGTGVSGFGVETGVAQGTVTVGTTIQNLQVLNNEIRGRQRGFFLNGLGNFTIKGNSVTVGESTNPPSGGYSSYVFWHYVNNGATGCVGTIDGNVVEPCYHGGGTGGYGITISAPVESGTIAAQTYNIQNNIVKSPVIVSAVTTDTICRGFSANIQAHTYNIRHNSLNFDAQVGISGTTAGRVAAVTATQPFTAPAGIDVRNNIFRVAEIDGLSRIVHATGGATGVSFAGNNMAAVGAISAIGVVGTTPYATMNDWQTAGYDTVATGGQSVNPTTTTPPWDANLKFPNKPIVGMGTVASSLVLTDIDGDARPATGAVPGADEPPALAGVGEWNLY